MSVNDTHDNTSCSFCRIIDGLTSPLTGGTSFPIAWFVSPLIRVAVVEKGDRKPDFGVIGVGGVAIATGRYDGSWVFNDRKVRNG